MGIGKASWESLPGSTKPGQLQLLELVFDYAASHGWVPADVANPALWKANLKSKLPNPNQRDIEYHPAMPYQDVPAFMAELAERDTTISAHALRFTILTAMRTNEVCGARWEEIDLNKRLWTVPKERMKKRREHVVPLSDAAVALLEALPRATLASGKPSRYVVVAARGRSLDTMAMSMLLRRMREGQDRVTVHGMRSSFRDWVSETTDHADRTAEFALGHATANRGRRCGDSVDNIRRMSFIG